MRDDGRRRVAVAGVDHRHDVVRDEDLERGDESRPGQGMGVDAEEQWAVDVLPLAIETDRLGDRHDVLLVEGIAERRAAMARGTEMDALRRLGRIRHAGKISADQVGGPDQPGGIEKLAGERAYASAGHAAIRFLAPPRLRNKINNFAFKLQ